MDAQHKYQAKKLALAIALTLGCTPFTYAELSPDPAPSAEELIGMLDNFVTDPETVKHDPIKAKVAAIDGTSLLLDHRNDLVTLGSRGNFAGLVDGAGGVNVLQLDGARGTLGKTVNFNGLHVKQGTWTRSGDGDFDLGVLVRSKASLTNDGSILGQAVTAGILINKGAIVGGATVLGGGDLTNKGLIDGTVTVHENGHFAGGGTLKNLNVHGRLSVDEVYHAPKVSGDLNLSQTAMLSYAVDAAGHSPTIEVGGTARLGGATLKLVTAGEYPKSAKHTILTAKKVEGRFVSIENNLAFMTPEVHYDDQKVGLTYSRNKVEIESLANTENGRAVGGAIDAPPEPTPSGIPTPLTTSTPISLSAPDLASVPVPDSVTALAPAPASVAVDVAVDVAVPSAVATSSTAPSPAPGKTFVEHTPQNVDQPAVQPQKPVNAAVTALLASDKTTAPVALEQLAAGSNANLAKATLSSVTPVSASMLSAMRQLDHRTGAAYGSGNSPREAAGGADSGRVWVQALGHGGKVDRENDSTLKHATQGLVMGADWRLNEQWHIGLLGGKSQTRLDARQYDGDLDSWHVGAYAVRQDGPLALRLGATYASHDGSSKRRVAFNGFSDRLKGNYDANTQQAFAELGFNFGRNDVTLEPFASLGYQRYQRDSHTEKGGDAALKVFGQTRDNLSSTFGLRTAKIHTLDNGMSLTPRLSAGWKHTFDELDSDTRQQLVKGGKRFTVNGAELDRNSLGVDAGLDLGLSTNHTLGVAVTGEFGSESRNRGVMGQWRMAF
ncbi:autotransporter domain-containing protein [Pseudomonas sp. B26140]|uniref:autotransporter family protein n=1 Tax=Pseudomonas sp. B26140 TaxID=3235112 RepID=UPI003784CA7C